MIGSERCAGRSGIPYSVVKPSDVRPYGAQAMKHKRELSYPILPTRVFADLGIAMTRWFVSVAGWGCDVSSATGCQGRVRHGGRQERSVESRTCCQGSRERGERERET